MSPSMSMKLELAALPNELWAEVFKHSGLRDLQNVRLASRDLKPLAEPFLFVSTSISLDLSYDFEFIANPKDLDKIRILASECGQRDISRHIRRLAIRDFDFLLRQGDPGWEEEFSLMLGTFSSAIAAMKNLHSVRFEIPEYQSQWRIDFVFQSLSVHQQLEQMEIIEEPIYESKLFEQWRLPFQYITAPLRHLHIEARLKMHESVAGRDIGSFVARCRRSLCSLHLADNDPYWDGPLPISVSSLLPASTGPYSQLQFLGLRNVLIDSPASNICKNVTALDIRHGCPSHFDDFWSTLRSENIHLLRLRIGMMISPSFLSYLESYTGLSELFVDADYFECLEDEIVSLPSRFWRHSITKHSKTLRCLIIWHRDWDCFGVLHVVEAIESCPNLVCLGIYLNKTTEDELTTAGSPMAIRLMHMLSFLPSLTRLHLRLLGDVAELHRDTAQPSLPSLPPNFSRPEFRLVLNKSCLRASWDNSQQRLCLKKMQEMDGVLESIDRYPWRYPYYYDTYA